MMYAFVGLDGLSRSHTTRPRPVFHPAARHGRRSFWIAALAAGGPLTRTGAPRGTPVGRSTRSRMLCGAQALLPPSHATSAYPPPIDVTEGFRAYASVLTACGVVKLPLGVTRVAYTLWDTFTP
jgi:hypothetical protein